jgi:hypothetical protein
MLKTCLTIMAWCIVIICVSGFVAVILGGSVE